MTTIFLENGVSRSEKIVLNAIHPYRFATLLSLVNQDHWLAHVLDRIIYRCQNSTRQYKNHQAFIEPLEKLRRFVGASSVKSLQTSLNRLKTLGVIDRATVMTTNGRRCYTWLTPKLIEKLPNTADNDSGINFHQAENIERYSIVSQLTGGGEGRYAFLKIYLIDKYIYLCQREANRLGIAPHESFIAITLEKLANSCCLSVRSLQRLLSALEKEGLIIKTRKKVAAYYVETRYSIPQRVWQALQKATTQSCLSKDRSVGNQGKSGQFQQGKSGHRHIDINKLNINKTHITVCDEKNVSRRTCSYNKHYGNVNLKNKEKSFNTAMHCKDKLDTPLQPSATLNPRQMRYVKGMLAKLATDHGCQFSDPSGLFHEICFAVRQVKTIFAGRTTFCHRVNLIAKLLRERRWTTPHGYERYDPKGRTQKARREEKERQEVQSEERAVADQPPLILPRRGGGHQSVGRVLARGNNFAGNPVGSLIPPEIAERLAEMRRLAKRAEAPDCSATAKDAIIRLLQQHQTAIKEIQYQKKAGQGS